MSIKYVSAVILFCLMITPVICQCTEAQIMYKKAVDIDKSTSLKHKTQALYALKVNAEKCNQVSDSGYIFTLIKIGKYEWIENYNINLAVQYTFQALTLNTAARYKISNSLLANACFNLATYYQTQHNYIKALAYYDTVAMVVAKADPEKYLPDVLLNKAEIYLHNGDYQKAIDVSTLGISSTGKDSANYLSFLNYRAQSYIFQNFLSQAQADLNTVLPLARRLKNHFELATAYKTAAMIYEYEKQNSLAESSFKEAIAERIQVNDASHIAGDYNDLGNFYLNSLSDYKSAENCYRNTILYANKDADTIDRTVKLLMAYVNLSEMAIRKKDITNVLKFYKNAFESVRINLPDFLISNPSINQLDAVGYSDPVFALLANKIQLLLLLFEEKKEQKYLTYSLQTAAFTDSFLTQARHEMLGEQSKLYWRNKTREFFSSAIEACYLANDATQAFYFMEKSRAVLLSDKLNELGADAQLSPAEVAKQESLQMKIVETEQLLSTINSASKEYAEKQTNLSQLREEQDNFIKVIEKNHPAYYQYKYADSVPKLATVQQYLKENHQSFVHYFMNDTVMYALGISPNKTTLIKLAAKDFDSHQLAEFLNICRDKFALNNNNDKYAALAQNIYKKIFAPLQLPPGNIAVCTDNFLIPFEALCTDANGKNYLLYHYNFSYVYSARSLMKPFTGKAASRNFIGFAPVIFSKNLQVTPLNQSAEALSKSAGFYNNATLFTDKQATRNSFFSNASNYAVINIFSHAQADTSEQEPRLYMQDSVIYLSELQLLKNPSAQFVLLSACQTNIGKAAAGEGIYSLARGFALAGIPAVSATLWNADEQTVYEISGKFNEYLAAGMNKSEALQKAKIWFIKSNSSSALSLPYFWANMVLIGSSQPIVLAQENYTWQWLTGAAFTLFLITFAVLLKRKRQKRLHNQ